MTLTRFIRILGVLCPMASMLASAFAVPPQSQPANESTVLDVGDRRQVFIDGRFLAKSKNVELVMHPPIKTGEHTIKPDQPWEGHVISFNNSVLWADGTYHMWYRAGKGMCYARSPNGITWEKPKLGLVEVDGSKDNNIVLGHGAGGADDGGQGGMVSEDPTAPPDQRFRMAIRASDPGTDVHLYSSPDGIHWKQTHRSVLTFTEPGKRHHLDSQNVIFWDDRIAQYVAYMRRNIHTQGSQGRNIARSESPTLKGFLQAQDAPVVIGPDDQDPHLGGYAVVDYYTSAAIKYPWAQDAYYMFPAAYFHYVPGGLMSEFPNEAPINAGCLDTQFAASRDGVTWHRFGRQSFVRLGCKGAFDSMGARVFYGLVPSVDGQEMYMYYLGTDRAHGWGRENSNNNQLLTQAGLQPTMGVSLISRLVLRRDGFVSARAAYTGGKFSTPPLTFRGRELVLNVDTSATGIVQCELQDQTGRPIEGYRLADCDRIHTANEINRVVKWRGKSDLSPLVGKPVRLLVVFRNADLYAFQFR